MMSDAPTPTEQFWLLTGEVPGGPFTVARVHAELAAGRATWQTLACPVGGSAWLPLVQTPGIGPTAKVPGGEANDAPLPVASAPPSATVHTAVVSEPSPEAATGPVPVVPVPSPGESRLALAVRVGMLLAAVALIGAAAYGVYEWVRPLTPTEVCDRFNEAKTAADAKRYATPRIHPLVDALYADEAALDPNAHYELTQEVDGPRPGTKLVGFKGAAFVRDAGRRVQMEGQFRLVLSGGWKIDDALITGAEGMPMDAPLSLVDDHRREQLGARRPPAPPSSPVLAVGTPPTPAPRQRTGVPGAFDAVRNNYGWGGVVAVVAAIAIGMGAWESMKKKRT